LGTPEIALCEGVWHNCAKAVCTCVELPSRAASTMLQWVAVNYPAAAPRSGWSVPAICFQTIAEAVHGKLTIVGGIRLTRQSRNQKGQRRLIGKGMEAEESVSEQRHRCNSSSFLCLHSFASTDLIHLFLLSASLLRRLLRSPRR
jgi:hypothetical protein